jgi:hypothetical protein
MEVLLRFSCLPIKGVKQLVSVVFLLIFFGYFSNSFAQVNITIDQVKYIFQPGQTHIFANSDSTLKSIDIGKTGGPNVYDFSNISLPDSGISTNYYVSSLPKLALRFPSSAITMGISKVVENNPVFLFGQDTMFVCGLAKNTTPEMYEHYVPYQIFGTFPLTFGDSAFQTMSEYDTAFSSSGSDSANEFNADTNITTIDGYGTLKIYGYQFECLRVKLNHVNYGDKEFIYLTREGIFIDIDIPASEPDEGNVSVYHMMVLMTSNIQDVKVQPASVPAVYRLSQNYPNPFNPSTTINYQVPAYSHVTITLFNVLGKEIKTIVDENKSGGSYSVRLNADHLASGIYYYRMKAGNFIQTKKLILLK